MWQYRRWEEMQGPQDLQEQRSNLIQNFRPSPDSIESSHRSSWYHVGFRQPRVITEMVALGAPVLIAIIFRQFTSYFSAVVHDIRPMEENCDFSCVPFIPSCSHPLKAVRGTQMSEFHASPCWTKGVVRNMSVNKQLRDVFH